MSLRLHQKIAKRMLDIILSFFGIVLSFPFLVLLLLITSIDTKSFGLIRQTRIGQFGASFKLLKFKTMRDTKDFQNYITTANDPRITPIGRKLRSTKLDELPQLWNVLVGQMSFVGPRPDVPGYANNLKGENRIILTVKPGITGPASLAFKHEEEILAKSEYPKHYNDHIIWPKKIKINKSYIRNYSFMNDIKIILKTIFG